MSTKTGLPIFVAGTQVLFAALAICVGLATSAVAQSDSRIIGLWLDHTSRGAVDITPCGTALCGKIVWLANPFTETGKPLTDRLNENASLRQRTICGLQIIGGTKRIEKNLYDNGWIYGPEKGKSFDVELRLVKEDRLQVTGYASLKIFSEVYIWKRLPETHPIRTEGKTCQNAVPE